LGSAQLLWTSGRVVVLDFDKCAIGDPAFDLASLLTQLRRLTLRKPAKLGDFSSLRQSLVEAYERWTLPDPDLRDRISWYEQITLLRKICFLACNTSRHPGAGPIRARQIEACQLLSELPALLHAKGSKAN